MVKSHEDLEVFKMAFAAAMRIFEISKNFPSEEKYSLTDQIRRASRSVCSNLAEAWRKRRYEASFVNKLNDSEGEAAEAQVWIRFAARCGYMSPDLANSLFKEYDNIVGKIVNMIVRPGPWLMLKASVPAPPRPRSSALPRP